MCDFPSFQVPSMTLNLGVLGSYAVPSLDPVAWANNLGTFVVSIGTYIGCVLGSGWLSVWKTTSSGLLAAINGAVALIFNAINAVFTTSEGLVSFMGPFAPIFAAVVTGTVGTALVLFSLLGLRALEIAVSDIVKLL